MIMKNFNAREGNHFVPKAAFENALLQPGKKGARRWHAFLPLRASAACEEHIEIEEGAPKVGDA